MAPGRKVGPPVTGLVKMGAVRLERANRSTEQPRDIICNEYKGTVPKSGLQQKVGKGKYRIQISS
jgi:hypothetical protein